MILTVNTKYSVGDTVYAVLYNEEFKLHIVEKKIAAIRVSINKTEMRNYYFLEGLHSFEGENWFPEDPDMRVNCESIYATIFEAQSALWEYDNL